MDYISKIFQHLYSVHLQIVINYDIIDDSFDILICTFLINLYFIKKFYQPIDNAERVKAQAQAAFMNCLWWLPFTPTHHRYNFITIYQ